MKVKTIYLLGCGGMGVAPLARYLKDQAYNVYGWDDYASEARKKELSYIAWQPTPPDVCDICVYSSALSPQNSPLLRQMQQRCRCLRRGEFVAELLKDKRLCVVCGSHGKSTTTAYLIHFFQQHQIPLNYLLGAEFQQDAYAAADGRHTDAWTLIELDESDGTMEGFSPDVSIILNTDWDHPQHYPTAEAYLQAFERLAQRTRYQVIAHQAFATSAQLYVLPTKEDYIESDGTMAAYAFQCLTGKTVTDGDIKSFPGLKRRREILLQTRTLTVLSDYAHHPSEVQAFWDSLQDQSQTKYIAFEPHRCSRLQCFFDDFVKVLQPIPRLYLKSVYQAFEQQPSVRPDLSQALPQAKPLEALTPDLFLNATPSLVAFVGAGYIDQTAHQWVQSWIQKIQQRFQSAGLQVQTETDLRHASTFHMGGSALFLCEPQSPEELQTLVPLCEALGLPLVPLGLGSNMLIPQERYDGVVVRLTKPVWKTCKALAPDLYEVGAGLSVASFLRQMEAAGVGGFEFLDGIPGTLGGALSMNAGTASQGILDHVQEVDFLDASGLHHLKHSQLDYHYRACPTLQQGIILSARLKGKLTQPEAIKALRAQARHKRNQSQPKGYSLGCFFKNTSVGPTGKILDELGLKNTRRGDIFVSPKHANFILNAGAGRFTDVLQLMRFLRQQVLDQRGILLEPEIRVLGKSWDQLL